MPDEAKDFIKNILVIDPKKRMTTKEMLAHPFIANEDIPKTLGVEAYPSGQIDLPKSLTSGVTKT